jgi:hypothetical protein
MMESVAGFFIPPACREEVLGDLHERFENPRQYFREALCTVPLVILSRIRRTTDPGVLLLEAFALYLSFAATAIASGFNRFLVEQHGYVRLTLPVLMALLALVLVDAYSRTERRPLLGAIAAFCALVFQAEFQTTNLELAFPSLRMILIASLAGMLLVTGLRLLFAPDNNRTTGA